MPTHTERLKPVSQEERVQWAKGALLRACRLLTVNPDDRALVLAVVGRQHDYQRELDALATLPSPNELRRREKVSAARKRDYLLRPHTRGRHAKADYQYSLDREEH